MKVEISKRVINNFKKLAKEAYPNEFCGFLVGTEDQSTYVIKDVYIPLEQKGKNDYIDVSVDWVVNARKLSKTENLKVIGFIHTHPDFRDTSLSEEDLRITPQLRYWLKEAEEPIMGVLSIWCVKGKLRSRYSFWPMFDQFKIKETV